MVFFGKYGFCIMLELVLMELFVEKWKDSFCEFLLFLFSRIFDFVFFVNLGFMNNVIGCVK